MIRCITENFIIAHWFVDQSSDEFRRATGTPNMNWIACVRCTDGVIHMTHRFAYCGDDEKRLRAKWQEGTLNSDASLDAAIAGLDLAAKKVSERNGNSRWRR